MSILFIHNKESSNVVSYHFLECLGNGLLDSTITLENSWKLVIEANEKSEISSVALLYAYLLVDDLEQIQHYATEIAEITTDRAEAKRA